MKKLANEVAIVTGSDSGIGQAIAVEFAREGASIVVVYHTDEEGAEETRQQVEAAGQQALVAQADVSDPKEAETLFEQARARFGQVDILVNNAGTNGAKKSVAEMEPEDFEKTIRTNLFGPFYICRLFARHRKEKGGKGKILNVTSVHEEIMAPETAD